MNKKDKFIMTIIFVVILGVIAFFALNPDKSNENRLDSLVITGHSINFNQNKESYNLTIQNSVNSLDIKAIGVNDKATITIEGNKNLKVGSNTILISVKALNKDIRTYKINVTKESANDNIIRNHKLKLLEITNYDIDFDPDKTSYNITVENNITSLNIKAIAYDLNDIVTINGEKDLKEGLNTIIIKISPNTGTASTYTINVTRNPKNNIPQE